MKTQIPGVAFGALKESKLPQEDPDLWQRIEDNKIETTRGRGLSILLDMSPDDLRAIRNEFQYINRALHAKPYPVRGIEGNITMQSVGVALGRIDDTLRYAVE